VSPQRHCEAPTTQIDAIPRKLPRRLIATPSLLFALCACQASVPAVAVSDAAAAHNTADTTREYLLQSAASDFHAHGPEPARFRDVRFGYVEGAGFSQMALICGEFEPAKGADAGKWIAFSTLKTSAYEQWLGDKSGYCARPLIGWEPGDLSAELLRRVEQLR